MRLTHLANSDESLFSIQRVILALGVLAGAVICVLIAIGVYGFMGSATIAKPFDQIYSEQQRKVCALATGSTDPDDMSLEGSGDINPAQTNNPRERCFYYKAPWVVNEVQLKLRLKVRDRTIGVMDLTVIPA
jgi:hypothetical protein